jgi:hypothetical protein
MPVFILRQSSPVPSAGRAVQRCGRLIDRGVMPDEKLPIPLMVFV